MLKKLYTCKLLSYTHLLVNFIKYIKRVEFSILSLSIRFKKNLAI